MTAPKQPLTTLDLYFLALRKAEEKRRKRRPWETALTVVAFLLLLSFRFG